MSAYGHVYDEATKKIYGPKISPDLDDRGIGYVLYHSMKQWAEDGLIAQIDAATGNRDSYTCFFSRCVRLAIAMRNIGIRPGDIISICSHNHLNSSVPYVACHFIGAIVAPTDPSISLEDQRHLLNLVKPKFIFVCYGSEDLILRALAPLAFKCEVVTFARSRSRKYRNFDVMIEEQSDDNDFQPIISEDPTATCLILFSSGTTGLAKGICLNHHMVMNIFASVGPLKVLKPRLLLYSSLYWISSVAFQTACFYYGLERVVCTYFDPQTLWEYIFKYEVQCVFLAPVQVIKSLEYLHNVQDENIPLKILLMGGSPIAAAYYQRLRDLLPGALVVNGYGQTEIGFISLFQKPDEHYHKKLSSVGFLGANYIAKIVDPDTDEVLGLKQIGEIRLKNPYLMNGYYNQDSSNVWDDEGFVKTGDLGYFDDDLCLYVTDRIKEMFKYQSWHIVPTKLEAILQSHPQVEMAIVVGVPHPLDESHALGGVTLLPNATVTANELEKYVEERVDERNRLRAGVVILDQVPLTPSGKIGRRTVKEILLKKVTTRS